MKTQKYSVRLDFRVTPEQKITIEKNAKSSGQTVSKYLRKMVIEKQPTFLSEDDRKELKELKQIGLEIKRTLNLYHEKRLENSSFLSKLRNFVTKIQD